MFHPTRAKPDVHTQSRQQAATFREVIETKTAQCSAETGSVACPKDSEGSQIERSLKALRICFDGPAWQAGGASFTLYH